MLIEKTIIGIKVEKDFKEKITKKAKEQDQNISEFIRMAIENEISTREIAKNQSYLYQILETIITNILEQKLSAINHVLKNTCIKQEFIIELLKTNYSEDYDKFLNKFLQTYQTSDELSQVS